MTKNYNETTNARVQQRKRDRAKENIRSKIENIVRAWWIQPNAVQIHSFCAHFFVCLLHSKFTTVCVCWPLIIESRQCRFTAIFQYLELIKSLKKPLNYIMFFGVLINKMCVSIFFLPFHVFVNSVPLLRFLFDYYLKWEWKKKNGVKQRSQESVVFFCVQAYNII